MADEDEAYAADRLHRFKVRDHSAHALGLPAQAGLPPHFDTPEEAARKEELNRATLDGNEALRKWAEDQQAIEGLAMANYRRYEDYHTAHVHLDMRTPPLADVQKVLDEALELARAKNEAYGDSWRKRGYMGNLARIFSKADRLENMVWQDDHDTDHEGQSESVEDTLLDLVNLAAFALVNAREGNRWGKR
jgi:hypothetical protein